MAVSGSWDLNWFAVGTAFLAVGGVSALAGIVCYFIGTGGAVIRWLFAALSGH